MWNNQNVRPAGLIALCEDIKLWSANRRTKNVLSAGEISAVSMIIQDRWRGSRINMNTNTEMTIVGFNCDTYTAATFFDPYYTPTREKLNQFAEIGVLNFNESIMRLMEAYLTKSDEENIINGEKIAVKGELNEIILRRGDWGEVINMF